MWSKIVSQDNINENTRVVSFWLRLVGLCVKDYSCDSVLENSLQSEIIWSLFSFWSGKFGRISTTLISQVYMNDIRYLRSCAVVEVGRSKMTTTAATAERMPFNVRGFDILSLSVNYSHNNNNIRCNKSSHSDQITQGLMSRSLRSVMCFQSNIIIIRRRYLCCCHHGADPLREFTRFTWWIQTLRQMAANPQTKPNNLGCESAGRLLPSTSTIAIIIIQPESWYSVLRPTEYGRLSRPRHYSNSVQPMPKAVYLSGRYDKHKRPRCDSTPGPYTAVGRANLYATATCSLVICNVYFGLFLCV